MSNIVLEIETKVIELGGKDYVINMPYADSIDILNEEIAKKDKDLSELKIMRKFFKELGLAEEALKVLQLKHYEQIIKGMMPKKD